MNSVAHVGRGLPLLLLLWVIVAVATGIGSLGGITTDAATANGLILLILVVGLGTFVGNSGVFSFGHAAFMGIGAYVAAVLTMSDAQQATQLNELPEVVADFLVAPQLAVLFAALAAGLFALLLSVPMVRLSGLPASLATVAILITMRVVFQNLETYTRGTRGLILDAPRPSLQGLLLWALLVIALALIFQQSAIGIRLVASREDELAARSVGIRVWWERGVAWVISGVIAGAGGALFALYFRSVNPDTFYLDITFTIVAMLVIGGFTSLSGAVMGSITLTIILEALRQVERGVVVGGWRLPARPGMTEVAAAVVLISILLLRPAGLTNGRELLGGAWPARSTPIPREPEGGQGFTDSAEGPSEVAAAKDL